jgi:hypothetical protein
VAVGVLLALVGTYLAIETRQATVILIVSAVLLAIGYLGDQLTELSAKFRDLEFAMKLEEVRTEIEADVQMVVDDLSALSESDTTPPGLSEELAQLEGRLGSLGDRLARSDFLASSETDIVFHATHQFGPKSAITLRLSCGIGDGENGLAEELVRSARAQCRVNMWCADGREWLTAI